MAFIDIKNLIYKYKTYIDEKEKIEKTAIDNLSLSIEKGAFVGILGANGSGKSTLAKQISALLFPTEGSVVIKGMESKDSKDILAIRQTASIVFQNPDNQIVGNTVEEDVAFGPENLGIQQDEMLLRIENALQSTGMQAYRFHSPGKLSGGQKQRVAISGILAMEPECIILDEPTAMLDPKGREDIIKAVLYLNREKGITILYITHHVEEVCHADYLYIMDKGKIKAEGKKEDLLKTEILEEAGLQLPFSYRLKEEIEKRKRKNLKSRQEKQEAICKGTTVIDLNPKPYLELDHICFHYEEKYPILQDVSLSVYAGEFLAVVGQTGSGKTTLLQQMNGLLQPQEGKIFCQGQDIHTKNYHKRAHRMKVAYCFQYPEYQLFEETVLKDICFGLKNKGLGQEECLKKAREAMELMELPPGIEEQSPFMLSGGQRRRVALAGILAMEPEVLLLDEPAAGLDYRGKNHLFETLHRLNKNKNMTIILISHDMDEVAKQADRVILMKEGKILADGPVRDCMTDQDLMEQAGLKMPEASRAYYEMEIRKADRIPITVEELAEYMAGEEL